MEFKEFSSPEEKDYDIYSGLNSTDSVQSKKVNRNYYIMQLIDLIGILEDVTEEDLQPYGITMKEYFNPNAEVIAKVTNALNNQKSARHR